MSDKVVLLVEDDVARTIRALQREGIADDIWQRLHATPCAGAELARSATAQGRRALVLVELLATTACEREIASEASSYATAWPEGRAFAMRSTGDRQGERSTS